MYQIRYESRKMAEIIGFKSLQDFSECVGTSGATVVFNYEHLHKARQKARALVSSGDSIYQHVSIWQFNPDTNTWSRLENVYEGKWFATVLEKVA